MPVPFSIRLDEATKARLDREAKLEDRSVSYMAQKAISEFVAARESKRLAIAEALKEADAGVFISDEAMTAWVDSWDSENELPLPKADVFLSR